MGYKLNLENMNLALNELKKTYKIYAPKVFVGAGTFSDTDRVRYGEIESFEEIEFDNVAKLLTVEFVKTGQYTVVPFPFKYLNEILALR